MDRVEGTVTRVLDADTVEIDGERMSLLGVDSPERWWWGAAKDCYAIESAQYLEGLILHQPVQYSYDRLLGEKDRRGMRRIYLYKGDLFINELLLKEGYAVADLSRQHARFHDFLALEDDARLHQRHLWHTCPVVCYGNGVCTAKPW